LVVDVSQNKAVELSQIEFGMRPAESKRWCESMTVVYDKSKSQIKYLVTEKIGEKIQVCYHSVDMALIKKKFKKEFNHF
jgi:hypothetical protein